MKKKIFVRAPVLTATGYGEQARFALRALRSREDLFDIYVQPIPWGKSGWIWKDDEEREWLDARIGETQVLLQQKALQPDISLQITIPNEFKKMCPINIGFTAGIETDRVSPVWLEKGNEMDKILVVSEHAKSIYESTTAVLQDGSHYSLQTPIEVVHETTPKAEAEEIKGFNPRHDFNFLAVSQFGPRKNFENTIKWFVEQFHDHNVGLIVKTSMKGSSRIDLEATQGLLGSLVASYPDRKCSVSLLHGDLSEGQMRALYEHDKVKALVNIAHGEGFGLPLFEAARSALPVVTIPWSGQMDFLSHEGKNYFAAVSYVTNPVQPQSVWKGVIEENANWAYAEEGSYKMALQMVHERWDEYKEQAVELQGIVNTKFRAEKLYEGFCEAIFKQEEESPGVEVSDIPKISLITSVFDAKEHIDQLLEDVTRQSIFEEKCEWVILNANPEGQDYEEEAIAKYIEKYPDNIVYQRLSEDPGIYAVWNKAIELSTGEFITNVNCDDRRSIECLEKQAKLMVSDEDVDLVYTDSFLVNEANVRWEDVKEDASRYNFEQFSKEAMLRGNLPHNNPMWRKSLHDTFGFFREDYRSASDWEFWLRCTFGGSTFKKTRDAMGVYYFNPEGMSTSKANESWKREEEKEIFQTYMSEYKLQKEGVVTMVSE